MVQIPFWNGFRMKLNKDCWRCDPSLDNWTQIEDIGHFQRGGHFLFSLNGRAYVGGGGIYYSGGSPEYDFYEFIP
jgi:hypothetical protein